jgi:hypothetical protein
LMEGSLRRAVVDVLVCSGWVFLEAYGGMAHSHLFSLGLNRPMSLRSPRPSTVTGWSRVVDVEAIEPSL